MPIFSANSKINKFMKEDNNLPGCSMNTVFEYVKRRGGSMSECITERYTIGYIIKGSCRVRSNEKWRECPESCLYLLNRGRHLIENHSNLDGVFEQVVIHFDGSIFGDTNEDGMTDEERRFERVVLSAIMTNTTISELAAQCFLSVSTFKRRFVARYGMPPHRWLLQQRLALARHILSTTSISTGDLAAACGFSNVSHFIQSFKSHFGTTPQSERRIIQLGQ